MVDIIVHMLDFKQMKERGFAEVFPSLFKFSMVAYCGHTRRLAVGSRLGKCFGSAGKILEQCGHLSFSEDKWE